MCSYKVRFIEYHSAIYSFFVFSALVRASALLHITYPHFYCYNINIIVQIVRSLKKATTCCFKKK